MSSELSPVRKCFPVAADFSPASAFIGEPPSERLKVKRAELKPSHAPKANPAIDGTRVGAVASRAPRRGDVKEPTSAAHHAPRRDIKFRSTGISASQVGASRGVRLKRIPIPTPFKHVPGHVVEAISVCRKIPHRTCIGLRSGVEVCVEAGRSQIVGGGAGRGVATSVVSLAFRNCVAPRKPLSAQPTSRRLLPLRFRRQPIAVVRPIRINSIQVAIDVTCVKFLSV